MSMIQQFKIDFLGLGAEKTGTTWLAKCLAEHPEIFIPKEKELFFFNEFDPHYLKIKNPKYNSYGLKWYAKQFRNKKAGQLVGEFTPTYLYCPKAAERIKRDFPQAKLIVVLREPVSRAWSQYLNDIKLGAINAKISFEDALKNNSSFLEKGRYYKYLKIYLSLFPKENILIILQDDIINDRKKIIRKVYQFLGLKNINFIPSGFNKPSNPASAPRFALLNKAMIRVEYFLRKRNLPRILKLLEDLNIRNLAIALRNFNTKKYKNYPKLKTETRNKLKKNFLLEIEQLEKLINRDLSKWRN